MKLLIIDNFDSFTYNLVHYAEKLNASASVVRYDKFDINDINYFDKILISPGPGTPQDYRKIIKMINSVKSSKSVLGICLGHQTIALAFGAEVYNTKKVNHGVSRNTLITDKSEYLFKNMPENFYSGRYHSWAVSAVGFPECLQVTAVDNEKVIMAFSHKTYDIKGVQFHPESVLTPEGFTIIKNWIEN